MPTTATTVKRIFLFLGIGTVIAFSQTGNPFQDNSALNGYVKGQQLALEQRRLQLEERKLFLSTLASSRLTEESAETISNKILDGLQDYPKGKKAKHRDEDVQLVMETLASLQSRVVP